LTDAQPEESETDMSVPTGPAVAAVSQCLENIERHNPLLNAIITPMADAAMADAERADAAAQRGEWLGLLHGMPMTLKDNIETAGVRTTVASSFFADRVPVSDAEVVRRLRKAGAVIVGKANLHEFVFGATSQSRHFGPCRNPWNPDCIPAGSSGGSGAAVASEMCVASIGSDTAGSIRMPAVLNGVVGLRPTIGRISNTGAFPASAAFDTLGPLARRAVDAARVFAAIAGHDPADPISEDRPLENFLPALHDGIAGMRVGVPRNFYFDDLDPEVAAKVKAAITTLGKLGADLVEVTVPGAEDAQAKGFVMVLADAAALHRERLDQHRDMIGADVARRLDLGREAKAVDYADAMRWREGWKQGLGKLFATVDLLITPASPIPAPRISDADDMIATARAVGRFVSGLSFGGNPSISVPCGFTRAGLPVGFQLVARHWGEPLLLRAAVAYQSSTAWHLERPRLLASA
jgi:aspartyl-tRNA(Asn)/glutamyl-tRNA(Gln) amidotransferase subunit A